MSGSSVLAGSHCRSSVVISRPRSSPVSRRPPVVARPTHVARHNVPVANFPGFLFNTCVAAYRRLLHGSQHRSRWTRRRPQHAWRNAHNCASVARAHSATQRPSALSENGSLSVCLCVVLYLAILQTHAQLTAAIAKLAQGLKITRWSATRSKRRERRRPHESAGNAHLRKIRQQLAMSPNHTTPLECRRNK